jgi:citronellol/citronellal dehydrogenase
MHNKTQANSVPEQQHRWGPPDEELASWDMVYRADLFKDQVVLVSGGGSGMGKGMAFMFARLGAKVSICGRNAERLEETKAAIKSLLKVNIDTYSMTIRDPEQVADMFEKIVKQHGRFDVLVNNAGGQYPQAAIDFSVKGWNAVIDTNLNGSWFMMQAAARYWRDTDQQGNIVNIVANVQRGMPQVAHTCAARAAVIYLSKSVSTEWASLGIRVNCVSPGSIATDGLNVYPHDAAARFKDSNPMRAFGHIYDVAQAVAYIAGPSGNFVTGEVLTVDGGNNQWGDTWPGGIPEYFDVDYGRLD